MTTLLSDLFPIADLHCEMADGFVRERFHPDAPLAILNYTEQAQYGRRWNDVTKNCRGLVYNIESLEVVARGFSKFFNWDESGQPYPPVGPMIMAPKFDGSLGILYFNPANDCWSIATRGSFTSDQAAHATVRLGELLLTLSDEERAWALKLFADSGVTFLFEIIYPENRIVVDYHGADRLVLLDAIDNATGKQRLDKFDELNWPDKAPKKFVAAGFSHSIIDEIPSGEEGFVLSWPERGFMCKMKSAEYVELHRIVTGLSKKAVWQAMETVGGVAKLRENVPDELYEWFDNTRTEFNDKIEAILDRACEDFDAVIYGSLGGGRKSLEPIDNPRATFARAASTYDTRAFLFKLYDNAPYEDLWKLAWKQVKPVGDTRVFANSEDVA